MLSNLDGEIVVSRLGVFRHRHQQLILDVAIESLFVSGHFHSIADDGGGDADGRMRTLRQDGDADADVRSRTNDSRADDDVVRMHVDFRVVDDGGRTAAGVAGILTKDEGDEEEEREERRVGEES